MRTLRLLGWCLTAVMMGLMPGLVLAGDCDPWVAKLVSREGSVEVKPHEGDRWTPATDDQRFCFGDQIRTGANTRASVELNNDTILRLDQHSTLILPAPAAKAFSFVELVKGALHLISRVRGRLEIRTPFVNAGLEGTEFVVRVRDNETIVSVIEGRVAVSNSLGQLTLEGGQSASASRGKGPILRLDLKPEDAVNWAIHYPVIIAPDAAASAGAMREAQHLLTVGRVDAARKLIDAQHAADPNDPQATALSSIIALAQNRTAESLQLAESAVATAETPGTLLALSFAQQAAFDLSGAEKTLLRATRRFPDDALLWSRLAELQASLSQRRAALISAQRAVQLDAAISRTQTVLGFARLASVDSDAAEQAFRQAISLDAADPLPRLGLGLAHIDRGRIAQGRREMEIAVSLDPGNSLVRSYLGKAYAHEGRGDEAAAEFELAKQLDPLDPTPWLYDALLQRAENREIAAIRSLEKSAALNGNRAVYRSRLLLDADLAARNAVIGSTYAWLGLKQLGSRHADRALSADHGNAAAHALRSDLDRDTPRHGMARLSERLQAQLLQPLSSRPVAPSELISELDPAAGSGQFGLGANEYSSLYDSHDPRFHVAGYAGGNDASGIELLHARRLDNAAYSLGYFKFDTDGFRENADVEHESLNGFVQFRLSDELSIQFDASHQGKEQGDLRLGRDPRVSANQERRQLNFNVFRAGAKAQISERSTLLAAISHADRNEREFRQEPFVSRTFDDNRDGWLAELQLVHRMPALQLIAGIDGRRTDYAYSSLIDFGFFQVSSADDEVIRSQSAYLYADWLPSDTFIATLGLSNDRHRDPNQGAIVDYSKLNPKAGLEWQFAPFANLRAAYIETTKHQLVSEATLQPTRIAGFNQFMDDPNQTKARLKGAALDLTLSDRLSATIEHTYRETDVVDSSDFFIDRRSRGELVAILNDHWTASLGYERRSNNVNLGSLPFELRTELVPMTIRYVAPNGYFANLDWTNFDQEWMPEGQTKISSRFDSVDLSAGYRWNKNRYKISVGVDDLLDDVEIYRDDRHMINDRFNVYRPFVPGRSFWGSIQMAWD